MHYLSPWPFANSLWSLANNFRIDTTVRSETANPSFSNSPWIFGAPQSAFSSLIWRMRVRTSSVILGRPSRRLDRQRQYSRKPLRCHAITVAGFTTTSTSDHRGHTLRSRIQKSRSRCLSIGRRRFRFSTATCCRSASTSKEVSRRLRKKTAKAARIAPIISIRNQL